MQWCTKMHRRPKGQKWHLPVIRIIVSKRLLHFGFGNDADGTCHATGLRTALLVAKILHDNHEGDVQTLLRTSSTCSCGVVVGF